MRRTDAGMRRASSPGRRAGSNHTRPHPHMRSGSLRQGARALSRHAHGELSKKHNASRKARRVVQLNASLLPQIGPVPPCPMTTLEKLPAKTRFKAASRQHKCAQPGVTDPLDVRIPLVWSRELVSSQRLFRNENPFETTKFKPFLQQLPRTSNMSRIVREGLCTSPSSGGACDTCAVVGASGSLLVRRHGALIDAHEVVLRPNWLLTKGYENIVGTRTDRTLLHAR